MNLNKLKNEKLLIFTRNIVLVAGVSGLYVNTLFAAENTDVAENSLMEGALMGLVGVVAVVGVIGLGRKFLLKRRAKQSSELFHSSKPFSLLLITTSNKLKGNIDPQSIDGGEYNKSIEIDVLKGLINSSRYFLIENDNDDMLEEAVTNVEIPDFDKENNFILKITGEGASNIRQHKTKSWLRENITSETCRIEKVYRLLDASIAEKFVPTI